MVGPGSTGNYFEHVVRDDESLSAIRGYIEANPTRWAMDVENQAGSGTDDPGQWLGAMIASRQRAWPEGKGEHKVRPYVGRTAP